MDSGGVLAALEATGPTGGGLEEPALDGPRTPLEALSRWLAALEVRPGLTPAPPPGALCAVAAAYARAQGWPLEVPEARAVGAAFARLGAARDARGGRRGYLVNRDAAAELWRAVGGRPRERRKPSRPRPKLPPPPRRTAHPTRPLRTCDGRVWRSQRELMAELGVTALAISRGVHNGTSVHGYHVRFATPLEVAAWRAQQEEWDGGIGSVS